MKKAICILMLEDREADVESIQEALRVGGLAFRLKRVDNKKSFLRELEHHRPDLILSDYWSRGLGGLAALALARKKCRDIPFIFVSAMTSADVMIDSLRGGATGHVLKRRLSTNLGPVVRRALAPI